MRIVICVFLLALSLFGQQPGPSAFQKLPFTPWQAVSGSEWYYIPMGYGLFSDSQVTKTKTSFENIMDRTILESQVMVSTETKSNLVRTGILVRTKKNEGGQ